MLKSKTKTLERASQQGTVFIFTASESAFHTLIECYRPPIHGTLYTTGVKGLLIGGLHFQNKEFACKKRIIVASFFF